MAIVKVSRRDFVKISSVATAGLVLGVRLDAQTRGRYEFGPLIEIGSNGDVTIWVAKSDMGQGVRTALPMIVAEELDADWQRVKIRQAHYDRKFGSQGTGGSSSVRTTWTPLRQAGASARAMLVSAAAKSPRSNSACVSPPGFFSFRSVSIDEHLLQEPDAHLRPAGCVRRHSDGRRCRRQFDGDGDGAGRQCVAGDQ